MSRSVWKNPFVDNHIIKNIKGKRIKTWSRSSVILPSFVNKTFEVHNGKKFNSVVVTTEMVGLKLGEFSPTRATYTFKKSKK